MYICRVCRLKRMTCLLKSDGGVWFMRQFSLTLFTNMFAMNGKWSIKRLISAAS